MVHNKNATIREIDRRFEKVPLDPDIEPLPTFKMHSNDLMQLQLGVGPYNYEPVASQNVSTVESTKEDDKLHKELTRLCPADLWPKESYAAGCPRPILVSKHHQQQMENIHEALKIAIIDIVRRWWTDSDAHFPERMPLEQKEEELLKWMHSQVLEGNIADITERLGSWRPDFMIDEDDFHRDTYRITEINARFSFNGFLHEAYGQCALDKSIHGKGTGLVGATDPELMLNGLFDLFRPEEPLHLLKGVEHGIDIHMFRYAVWRRFGRKPRLITPADLRLLPDPQSKSGYKLCCLAKSQNQSDYANNIPSFAAPNGEIWEEICQVGLELHQRELIALQPEMLRQISLRCFNDMRTILLVHDKRMLGIIRQELPEMIARRVLTSGQAGALERGIVDTIIPGSTRMRDLLSASKMSPEVKDQYLLKPIRSGKGDGIVFGDEMTQDQWVASLERLECPQVIPGVTCVVQKLIVPRLYDMVLKASDGMVKYPLVGTYHVTNGRLLGLGIWRANGSRLVAVSSGGSWICSVMRQETESDKSREGDKPIGH